jgi:hypothetical protein
MNSSTDPPLYDRMVVGFTNTYVIGA